MKQLLKFIFMPILATITFSVQAGTLEDVQKKGHLSCGVSIGTPGFSSPDSGGNWSGMDVDVCRAIAAAVLGNAKKVRFVPLTAKERFIALQSGEVDVLSRNTTWTHTRDTSLGLSFAGVNYYDGQGFMVKKSLGVDSVKELDGASFCVQAGTTTELNLSDYFRSNNMKFKAVTYDTAAQTKSGFEKGRCDALTSDVSQLAGLRSTLANPNSAVVLGDVISKEPLGPVVRKDDNNWFNIVKWSLNAMIEAEELGVTSANIDNTSTSPGIQRLQGRSGKLNEHLGLGKYWSRDIIKQVGNYGEVFERNIGMSTPIQLPRGVNQLWIKGGILYAPAFR